jgi:hypothetical protein
MKDYSKLLREAEKEFNKRYKGIKMEEKEALKKYVEIYRELKGVFEE